MRFLLLIACVAALSGAEAETFILRDGRKLVGTYDEASQTLTLIGSPAVSIKVRERDIEKRSPADPELIKSLEKPQQKVVRPDKPAETKPKSNVGQLHTLANEALAEKTAEADRLREQATDLEFTAIMGWLSSTNLDPIPVPELPSDPKKSEYEAKGKADRENEYRKELRSCLEQMKSAKVIQDKQRTVVYFHGIIKRLSNRE